jgi:hypothetical protein
MKKEEKNNSRSIVEPIILKQKRTVNQAQLILPPGVKFGDVYMDASEVAQELNISKRGVRNMRVSGKISYTNPFGKIYYYRQEIAAVLEENKKPKRI